MSVARGGQSAASLEKQQMSGPSPTLGAQAARQLANTTKTPPQWIGTTPRWLVSLLPWTPVEAGTYRVNQVKEGGEDNIGIECSPSDGDELPKAFVDYEEKERQERELINNPNYGLLSHVVPYQRISTRVGPPTPDDLDELITKVWKEPAFFLAHPKAIAAFGRECTRRGVPPPTTTLFGSPFLTWRGLPLIPSDKLDVYQNDQGRSVSNILLLRTGEKKRGVVGLFQPGIPGEVSPSLSVRWMGINDRGAASYLVSLYCSAAVLAHDAIAVLENVDI